MEWIANHPRLDVYFSIDIICFILIMVCVVSIIKYIVRTEPDLHEKIRQGGKVSRIELVRSFLPVIIMSVIPALNIIAVLVYVFGYERILGSVIDKIKEKYDGKDTD